MILTDVEDLVAGPVSRVIIRDPQATAEDFVELAAELGLHGTDYVVGWTAWLDLAPVGVTKASGLQYVVDQLGLGARRRPRHRRRPQRHRDAPVGRSGGRDGSGRGVGHRRRGRSDRRRRRGRRGHRDRALVLSTRVLSTPGLPRLVATDLDGTLVRSDGSVSDYTRDVLAALEDLGVPVVFVTGRPLRWAEDVFEHVGGHGLAVVSNGALVWDVARSQAHLERPVPAETARDACRVLREAVPGSAFAAETLDGIGLEPQFMERHPVPRGARRAPIDDLLSRPLLKLLARHEQLGPQEYWDAAEAAIGHLLTITWSSSTTLLEMSAVGVTKASTLALLAAELGVDAQDVIAFGDMPNDLPMLTWAGASYAMADAHPSVHEAADHRAPGHDEDGVAQVLAKVFGL